jgi:membrane protein implicated in regulation of membrane protease activity
MALIAGSILVAMLVLPPPWGPVLVSCAIICEIAEKAFWFRSTRRIPIAVGREAMIGLPVTVISPCQPEGRVQLLGERWKARCTAGAGLGEALVIEAVEQITLVVGKPGSDQRGPLAVTDSRRMLGRADELDERSSRRTCMPKR